MLPAAGDRREHTFPRAHGKQRPYPVNWIIAGCESKQGKDHQPRPYHLDRPLRIIRDGRRAGIAVFVKQLGSAPVGAAGWQEEACRALRHPKGENPAEWPEPLQVREIPAAAQMVPMPTSAAAQKRRAAGLATG